MFISIKQKKRKKEISKKKKKKREEFAYCVMCLNAEPT